MTPIRMAAVKIVIGTCPLILGVLLTSETAWAQTEADAVRARVKEGQKVRVTDDTGREFKGRISSMTDNSLGVLEGSDRADIPYASIVKIDRPHDGVGNGALIGLAVGAGLGFAAIVDAESCEPEEFLCGDPGASSYLGGALLGGGLGAAIGVGIDALIRRNPSIYRRGAGARITLSPAVGRGARGAVLAISW